jgi:hypothetical protein
VQKDIIVQVGDRHCLAAGAVNCHRYNIGISVTICVDFPAKYVPIADVSLKNVTKPPIFVTNADS